MTRKPCSLVGVYFLKKFSSFPTNFSKFGCRIRSKSIRGETVRLQIIGFVAQTHNSPVFVYCRNF